MDLCKIRVNYGCLATGEGTTEKIRWVLEKNRCQATIFHISCLASGVQRADIALSLRTCYPVKHRVLGQKVRVRYQGQTITQGLKITEKKVLPL